jgi:hypothetical protein
MELDTDGAPSSSPLPAMYYLLEETIRSTVLAVAGGQRLPRAIRGSY